MLTLTEIMTISECYPEREHFARAVIAAYEAKLREQEPVGYLHKSKDDNSWDHLDFDSYDDEYGKSHWNSYPIYLHPAPIPEGWQLVPIEPTTHMVNEGLCGCMDNDVTVCIYKKMLAAARSGE